MGGYSPPALAKSLQVVRVVLEALMDPKKIVSYPYSMTILYDIG
jgi:hypothetical protein